MSDRGGKESEGVISAALRLDGTWWHIPLPRQGSTRVTSATIWQVKPKPAAVLLVDLTPPALALGEKTNPGPFESPFSVHQNQ